MTFAQLARYVAENSAPDGDSVLPIPSSAPYLSTSFGQRLARIVRQFTTDTPLLFASMQPITIPQGQREYSLVDPANTTLSFWHVRKLWVNGQPIRRLVSAGMIMASWGPNDGQTPPTAFAHVTRSKIVFNTTPPDGLESCFAMGFYRHPEITSDDDVIDSELEDVLDLFDRYAQVNLRQDVAGDEIGINRLQRVDKQAFDALRKINGERMKALIEGGC